MSLSKKHFKEIALIIGSNAIPDKKEMPGRNPKFLNHFKVNVNVLAYNLSAFFKASNPLYDEERFINAVRAAAGLRPMKSHPEKK